MKKIGLEKSIMYPTYVARGKGSLNLFLSLHGCVANYRNQLIAYKKYCVALWKVNDLREKYLNGWV